MLMLPIDATPVLALSCKERKGNGTASALRQTGGSLATTSEAL